MEPLLTEIDHVAIAVNDLEAAIAWYAEVLGALVVHREVVESDGVEEALVRVADSYIQLLTPTRDDSPVAKYLANKGEGLHHIAYRVDDCARRARRRQGVGRARDRRRAATGFAKYVGRIRSSEGVIWHVDRARAGARLTPTSPDVVTAQLVRWYFRVTKNSYFAVTQGTT